MVYVHVVHPWPPVEGAQSKVLILGTLPSPASLRDGWYYGHPRNAFWSIMGELYGAHKFLEPERRAEILVNNGFALWDVLKEADVDGSSDAKLRNPVAQDFNSFLHAHPKIQAILFNGTMAQFLWRQFVDPTIDEAIIKRKVRVFRLPSSSPANAIAPAVKLAAWKKTITEALDGGAA